MSVPPPQTIGGVTPPPEEYVTTRRKGVSRGFPNNFKKQRAPQKFWAPPILGKKSENARVFLIKANTFP